MWSVKIVYNITTRVDTWDLEFSAGFFEEITVNVTNIEPANAIGMDLINIDKSKLIQTTALAAASKLSCTSFSSKFFSTIASAAFNVI